MRKLGLLAILLVLGVGILYWKSTKKPDFEPAPDVSHVTAPTPAPAPAPTPEPKKEVTQAPARTEAPGTLEEKAISALAKAADFMRKEDPEGALNALQEALKTNPDNADLQTEIGSILANAMNNPVQALSHFEKALKSNPSNERALSEVVGIAAGSSKEGSARGVEMLRSVIQNNPKSPIPHMAMADYHMRKNNLPQGIASLETAAGLPGAPESANMRLAQAYYQANQPERAQGQIDSVAKSREQKLRERPSPANEKKYDEARIDQAYSIMNTPGGDLRKAEEIVRPFLAKYPDDAALQTMWSTLQARLEGRPVPGAMPPPPAGRAEAE